MKVVVVESPAKAKTINRYLGDDYIVLASYGHVRDLPSKDGSVQPDQDFEMSWQLSDSGGKRIKDITDALKGADRLILATDPDPKAKLSAGMFVSFSKPKKSPAISHMSALCSTKSPKAPFLPRWIIRATLILTLLMRIWRGARLTI